MKNHRDAYKPDDSTVNHVSFENFYKSIHLFFKGCTDVWWLVLYFQKMYVICDLAMHIILTKSNNYDVRDFSLDARIPSMYYQAQPESYQNVQSYIPEVYLPFNSTTAKKTGIVVPVRNIFTISLNYTVIFRSNMN